MCKCSEAYISIQSINLTFIKFYSRVKNKNSTSRFHNSNYLGYLGDAYFSISHQLKLFHLMPERLNVSLSSNNPYNLDTINSIDNKFIEKQLTKQSDTTKPEYNKQVMMNLN